MSENDVSTTHEKNHRKICAPCGEKIVLKEKKLEWFSITEKYVDLIKKFLNEKFDLHNSKFPLSICVSCRLSLDDYEKGDFKRPVPVMPNYLDIQLPKNTRQTDNLNCCDFICTKARYKGHVKPRKGAGNKRKFENRIVLSTQNNVSSNCEQSGKTLNETTKSVNLTTRCKICWQEIGRGLKYPCSAKTALQQGNTRLNSNLVCENVVDIVKHLPERQQDRILCSLLKDRTSKNDKNKKNINIELTNVSGSAMKIALHPVNKVIKVSNEEFSNFQVNTGSSGSLMKKMANFVRCIAGKHSVPPKLAEHLSLNSKLLSDLYHYELRDFDVEGIKGIKEKRPVVYADAEKIVSRIIEHRNLIGDYHIKVLADGGQGFFKICLTLFPHNYNTEKEIDVDDKADENVEPDYPVKKRRRYCEGAVSGEKAKLTSVNRLIILCLVPKIKETYGNLESLFELTKLNNIPFKFVDDFKFILLVNGQQTAISMFPCPYCCVCLRTLRNSSEDEKKTLTSKKKKDYSHLESRELKTFGQLKNDFQALCDAGKNKILAPNYHSTINASLFQESDDLCVLEKCIVPELHILQGFVNHLFWDGIVRVVGREKALVWPRKLGIISKAYHGEVFEGNGCKKLLSEADKLLDPQIYEGHNQYTLVPFVSALKAFDKLVNNCFSTKKVNYDVLSSEISNVKKAYEATEMTETLKIHVLLDHLAQCLQFLGRSDGLGIWSEQAGESVHHAFLKTWNKYKVNSMVDAEGSFATYAERLMRAVVEFSSQHI